MCPRQHPVSVALVIGHSQITLERFNQFRLVARLLILFSQAKKDGGVRRIAGEHLFKDFDS